MKTVSLELTKQLKVAGYPQEGLFWWGEYAVYNQFKGDWKLCNEDQASDRVNYSFQYYSPTADEILDQLPVGIHIFKNNSYDTTERYTAYFRVPGGKEWKPIQMEQLWEYGSSPADAAAKMWIYLKKEGLL